MTYGDYSTFVMIFLVGMLILALAPYFMRGR